jgi:hypothetical protein
MLPFWTPRYIDTVTNLIWPKVSLWDDILKYFRSGLRTYTVKLTLHILVLTVQIRCSLLILEVLQKKKEQLSKLLKYKH